MLEKYNQDRRLWVPGQKLELHDEYPVPSQSELNEKWRQYVGRGAIIDAPNVFGVLRLPDSPPRAYASIDVCEVLRQTNESMRLVEDSAPKRVKSIHTYGEGMSFEENKVDITSILQVLMNNKNIAPIDGIKEIAAIMRGWRKDGIYTFANTSTLPGCELGTIDFFSEHLPGAFDGLLLPRNHDGKLPMTKGVAARNLIQAIPPVGELVIATKIDDASHHNVSFRKEVGSFPSSRVRTFLPEYPTHYIIQLMPTVLWSPRHLRPLGERMYS